MLALVKRCSGSGNVALMDVPEPQAGPEEVKIAVRAAGVCGSDLHVLHGTMQYNMRYPLVMGHEYAGAVAAVGEGVEDLAPGDRVTSEMLMTVCGDCLACRTGALNQCERKLIIGYYYDGCFAEYIVVPRRLVHRLPENVTFAEGALIEPLACCVHAVLEQTRIVPADLVVVSGPGTIGLLCMQLAKAASATVVAVGTGADCARLEMARALGAEVTVNVEKESLPDVIKGLTGGQGADVYLECSGAPAAARAGLTVTRRGGRYTQIGLFDGEFSLDFGQVCYRELQVVGSVGSRRQSWVTALKLVGSGAVKLAPLASQAYPLAEWGEAFRVSEGKLALKVLLIPADAHPPGLA